MPTLTRRLRLVVLLTLLAAILPAALPAFAQSFTVTSTADSDDNGGTCPPASCTLRKAIRLANENAGADTISFSLTGTAPFTISPTTALPALSGGGTTIDGGSSHTVVLSGAALASGFGLRITSANNEVRGMVIVGFTAGSSGGGGSGISLFGDQATGNRIYNNWIGLNADGSTAFGNKYYGVQMDEGASDNTIGGAGAGQGNVIAGNLRANIAVDDSDSFTSGSFISGNQIVKNRIGTNAAGTAAIANADDSNLNAGVLIGTYARSTVIQSNLIAGHIGPNLSIGGTAGILLISNETSAGSTRHPRDTSIVDNDIGITASGTLIANRIGIRITGTAINTLIGDPADPVGGRNYVGGGTSRAIEVSDNNIAISGTQIVGNYVGIARNGTTLAASGTAGSASGGEAIFIGITSSGNGVTVGPANVIAAARRYAIRIRSSNNVVKGNYIGTNPAGSLTSATSASTAATLGFGTGGSTVWVETGSGNQIGGAAGGDRNVIATGGFSDGAGAAVLIQPCTSCSVASTTVQGNYLGVAASGDAALFNTDTNSEGMRISGSSGNSVLSNVISGVGRGITLRNAANTNTISQNRIGTNAGGTLSLAQAIRNKQHGIYLISGTGNQITNNLIAYNGSDAGFGSPSYSGITLDPSGSEADNNQIIGNRLVGNGKAGSFNTASHGVAVNGAVGIRISQSTTSGNTGDGISLSGGNGDLASPTLTAAAGAPVLLTGSAPGCPNCTVEVFTSATSDDKEGPIYLTSGTSNGGGAFSINVAGCLRYLTATVRAANNNTSPFSSQLDSGAAGPCTASTFTLGAASPANRNVAPGSSTTYAHSITNNAAVARSFSVVVTSTLGWASAPALVSVPANSSASFNVVVSVPLDAQTTSPADVDTSRVQIFLGGSGSAVQTDTTTAQAVTVNPAAPAVSPGQTKARAGNTVVFTHSVTNTGDLAGTFSVVGPSGSGGPTFVGTPPTGWTIASALLGKTSLAGGESTSLTITVNTPAGAPAANVQISFRVKVASQQTDPATVDTITVPVSRSFTFVATNPTGAPPTISRPPGAAASFVYSLTNTGNATDSFSVTPPANTAALSFSVSPSGSFSLAANASRTITLTAQVASAPAPAAGNYDFTVTAQAVGGTGLPASQPLAGRVAVTGGGAPKLSFGAGTPNPINVSAAGGSVSFTGTLTNTGNQTANFSLGAPAVTGSPAGWSAALVAGGTCGAAPISLATGASCTFTLQVTVPQGATGGAQAVTLSATADNGPAGPSTEDVTASATATVNVAIVRGVGLTVASPADTQIDGPGQVLTFTHTLTNTGNATDSFSLSLTPTAPATTAMAVLSPASLLNVPRGATRTVTLVVTVPSGVVSGTALPFTIAATSQGSAAATASRTDTVTVQAVDGAAISPGKLTSALPGATITYTHILTNTGSTSIAYAIVASNSQSSFGAPVISPASPLGPLNPGQSLTFTVAITVPADIIGGTLNSTSIQVFADGSSAPLLASATDQARIGNNLDVLISPNRVGTGLPGSSAVFTHTVTNIGITADSYDLTASESNGLPIEVAPNLLILGPGASQLITVTVTIPEGTQAGTLGFARVTATSRTDPTISGDATEDITVLQQAELSLSFSQARTVTPASGTIRLTNLTLKNLGNAADSFDLSVSGLDPGWGATVTPFVQLGKGESEFNVRLDITVPSTISPGPQRVITVVARSRFDPSKFKQIQIQTTYTAPEVLTQQFLYLPLVAR